MLLQKKALTYNAKVWTILAILLVFLCGILMSRQINATDMCPYHQEHNEECGYVAPVEGNPCTHEHGDECYKTELICTKEEHQHSSACYDENNNFICTIDQHQHGDECYKKMLNCKHVHDEACGYQEVVDGHECGHRCVYCNEALLKTGKITFDVEDNTYTVHIHSELEGTPTDDQLYYYIKFDKSLLEKLQLEKQKDGTYFLQNKDNQGITFTPVYIEGDNDNVYLKYIQDNDSILDFDIVFISEAVINKYITLNYASSLHEDDQVEVYDQFVVKYPESSHNTLATTSYYSSRISDDEIDFSGWITSISLQHRVNNYGEWIDVSDGTVNVGDNLRFGISYTIPGNQLSNTNNTIVYELPDKILLVEASSGNVYNDVGNKVGVYNITTDGKITITFDDDYVSQNANGQQISGTVYFESSVSNIETEGKTTVELPFRDDLIYTLLIDGKTSDDLVVSKTATNVSNDSGTITYQIEVTSKNGTSASIILDDIMSSQLEYVGNLSIVNEKGETISVDSQPSSGSSEFSLTLPQLSSNGKYIITYVAKLKDNNYNGTNYVNNKVHVSSYDSDNNKISYDASVDTTFIKKLIEKTGTRNDDGTITWTIKINESRSDIGGWVLSDILDNTELTNQSVSIQPSINGSNTITLPYTFPEGTKEFYTITYTTSENWELGSYGVTNKAILYNGDKSYESSSSIGDNGAQYNPISKSADNLTLSDDGNAIIDWHVVINADKGNIEAQWVYYDELWDNQWFTVDQMNALEEELKEQLSKISFTESDYSIEKLTYNGDSTKFKGYKIIFYKQLNKGQSFEINYQSTAPLGDGKSALSFRNSANINNKIWKNGEIGYKPIVRKYDANDSSKDETTHGYYDSQLGKQGILKWGFTIVLPDEVKGQEIIIKEKLPQGVTIYDEGNEWGFEILADGLFGAHEIKLSKNNETVLNITVNGTTYSIKSILDDNNVVTVTLPENLTSNSSVKELRFVVKAKINDDYQWSEELTGTFKNEVIILNQNNNEIGKDDQTQIIIKNDNDNVIDKKHYDFTDNIATYSIDINPDGRDLLQGASTLTFIDEMKYAYSDAYPLSVSLVPGSVKVYKRNSDGTKGDMLSNDEFPYSYVREEESNNGGTHNMVNKICMTIPDSQPLIIEYQYKTTAAAGYTATLHNTARLEGITGSEIKDNDSFAIRVVESGATANVDGVTIYKVDSLNHGLGLENAKFNLYRWNQTTNEYEITSVNEQTELSTNSLGQLSLVKLAYNTAYKLVEIQAPEGYVPNSQPYYFIIKNNDTIAYPECKPTDFMGEERASGDVIYYENTKSTTDITIEKYWQDNNGNYIDGNESSIDIELWRTTEIDDTSEKVNVSINIENENNNTFWKENYSIPKGKNVSFSLTNIWGKTNNWQPQIYINGIEQNNENVIDGNDGNTRTITYEFTTDSNISITGNINWNSNDVSYSGLIYDDSGDDTGSVADEKVGTYTILATDGWKKKIENLPIVEIKNEERYLYKYYIKEINSSGYEVSYSPSALDGSSSENVSSGIITITNKKIDTLPETGGTGSSIIMISGLTMICFGLLCVVKKKLNYRKVGEL